MLRRLTTDRRLVLADRFREETSPDLRSNSASAEVPNTLAPVHVATTTVARQLPMRFTQVRPMSISSSTPNQGDEVTRGGDDEDDFETEGHAEDQGADGSDDGEESVHAPGPGDESVRSLADDPQAARERHAEQDAKRTQEEDGDKHPGQERPAEREVKNIRLEEGSSLIQSVHLYQGVAGGVLKASHNRGVAPGRERARDRGFQIVCRRQAGAGDDVFLRIFPIVV